MTFVSERLAAESLECIEAEWQAHDRILRLFVDQVDHERGNVGLDDCVRASRMFNECPELDEMVSGTYTLEVSSPGLERPLRRAKCFARFAGRRVEARLKDKVGERRQGVGTLQAVHSGSGTDDTRVTLATEQGDWTFALCDLHKAHLVHEWGDG